MKKINLLFPILLISVLVFQSCKKDDSEVPQKSEPIEDDGLSLESEQSQLLNNNLDDLESGLLKDYLDTSNLPELEKYVVLFKSEFQPPLADVIDKSLDDRLSVSMIHERNAKNSMAVYVKDIVAQEDILDWFSVLSSGFHAELTPKQVKALYSDRNVKCVAIPPTYESDSEPIFNRANTSGNFVHGYKSGAGKKKAIWIIDKGPSLTVDGLNIDQAKSAQFYGASRSYTSHGTSVAITAAGEPRFSSQVRGTAPGAKVVLINTNLGWVSLEKALEYTFNNSRKGDIVNCSFSTGLNRGYKNRVHPLVVDLESSLLKFWGWDQPVVIAAGNQNTFASNRTPARLGMKYKDNRSKYGFIYVCANIQAVGTDQEIKSQNCTFKLNTAAKSNYGRAIRYGLIGDCQTYAGSVSGTSLSAPALCGILYHRTPSVSKPKEYEEWVRHFVGKYAYIYKVPKF